MAEDSLADVPAEACRRLWAEVLLRMVTDALWVDPRAGASTVSPLIQHDARRWFESRDFEAVCSLADVDAEMLKRHVVPVIGAPEAERAAFLRRLRGRDYPGRPPMSRLAAERAA